MSDTPDSLGAALDALCWEAAAKAQGDPLTSYTASLLAAGPAQCAKKLGEEGVEMALALVSGDKGAVAAEAADLLYHFAVALQVAGVAPEAVAAELARRRGVSGLAEKASRG
jgi:phosphoribosyl-ATP pyrophosphohydrolase